MNYYLTDFPDDVTLPAMLLRKSTWNDYGFMTTFNAYFRPDAASQRVFVGQIKIASKGLVSGRPNLPNSFDRLDSRFFSLGQSDQYFDEISKIKNEYGENPLKDLRDLTSSRSIYMQCKDERAYIFSLARSLGASKRIKDRYGKDGARLTFDFSCALHNSSAKTKCHFEFESDDYLPGRINILVGKNGVGKTQYLAHLVASMIGVEMAEELATARKRISKVAAVSYNIFDKFFLPDEIAIPSLAKRQSYVADELRYKYIGLREKVTPVNTDKPGDKKEASGYRITSGTVLGRAFVKARNEIRKSENDYVEWKKIASPLLQDANLDIEDTSDRALATKFSRLGSGHKATLSILTRLFEQLDDDSLVVLDEPENHLHPTLLSMTMSALRAILEYKNSHAIISTHSPSVVQEVPAKYVTILKRTGGITVAASLSMESFGTNLESITTEIFGVPNSLHNYAAVLKKLSAQAISLKDIDHSLKRSLSFEARSLFLSLGGDTE